MDEIVKKTEELKEALYEKKEFKEYFRLKELIDNNEEIASLKIQMAKAKDNPEQLELLKKEYNSHPLVVNYAHALEEVKSILLVIKDIIEK